MQLYVDDIRKMYEKDWDSKDTQRQQMGCALYFIDQLALRAGHEKDDDEADTVGCCTLKVCSHLPFTCQRHGPTRMMGRCVRRVLGAVYVDICWGCWGC